MWSGLRSLLTDTITIEPWSGHADGYGNPSYGTPITVSARIVRRHRLVRDTSGREIVSSSQAVVDTSAVSDVDTRSRITLPDGTQPRVLSVERSPAERGEIVFIRINFG